MSQPTTTRPPQVTLASGIIIFSSVVVLLTVWERVSTLGTLETQDAIRDALDSGVLSASGLSVDGAAELVRISSMVMAACACATAILGWFVRTPDRTARLALSVFAVPVLVTDLAAGGLAGSFVGAGAAMLWLQPGREWFATGKWTPPAPVPQKDTSQRRDASGPTDPWGRPLPPPSSSEAPTAPPPASRPYGEPVPPHQPPTQPSTQPSTSPYGQPHASAYGQAQRHPQLPPPPTSWQERQLLDARPGAMVAAFVITVVTAGGLLALSLLWLALAGLSPDLLMSAIEQQQPELVEDGLTLGQIRSAVVPISVAFIVWGVVALTLAGFAMARRAWARRGLMVSAGFSAGACLALVLTAPLLVFPAAAALATVVCLRRVEVRRWFALEPR